MRRRIVLFSGGTACRTINIALCRQPVDLVRVVPAWDSGGSSKVLRDSFAMLPVGDIRQALMTMAHGEGRSGSLVKICNARLSDDLPPDELRAEFEHFVSGAHPLIGSMPEEVRAAILGYLRLFQEHMPADFDLSNGSVGNFVLTGAWLANGFNINRAVAVFRRLCEIEGMVWPASTVNDARLSATLANGKLLPEQHVITRMTEADAAAGIASLELTAPSSTGQPAANALVLQAVSEADILVFGPGSFYTSILPHLLVDGMIQAISANRRAAKVFVGNILDCPETRRRTLNELLQVFVSTMKSGNIGDRLLTHAIVNRELFPFEKRVGRFAYLRHGDLPALCAAEGIELISGDFEDAWTRGQHDGDAVAARLAAIAGAVPAAPRLG